MLKLWKAEQPYKLCVGCFILFIFAMLHLRILWENVATPAVMGKWSPGQRASDEECLWFSPKTGRFQADVVHYCQK